ncbi:MAG TPA: O-antigen ligase family protein [Allosphingosinicella sp.]|nr:O-antigen ligase family protein [Allosphingosinicella sp.]
MIHVLRLALVPAYLVLCLVLGGASGGGYWANVALQLLAIPIILWAVVARRSAPISSSAKQVMLLLALAIMVVLVQLVPLPPSIWTSLGGRGEIVRGFEMLGQPLPWMPISLAPYRTIASALWMLPALAIWFGIVRLGGYKSSWLAVALIVVTACAVGVGALQLAGGENSSLYFYRITNRGSAVGFFANSNNMAELLVVAIPFLAMLYLMARRGGSLQKSSALLLVLIGALSVLLVGIAVNGSLAGIGLAVPALGAAALMILYRRKRLPVWAPVAAALLLAGSAALMLSAPFQNNLTSEQARTSQDSRYSSFGTSIQAAKDYLPLGSGIGTFPEIYPRYENPQAVTRWYMNHVHNDYIEVALETGLPGMALVALFLLWWLRRVFLIWRADEPDHAARAATIASAVILTHSFVEFPLRTAAISAVFAMCVALMAEPRPRARQKTRDDDKPAAKARHLSAD